MDDERGTAIDHSTPQLQLVLMGVIANTIVPINSLSVCEWTTGTGGRASRARLSASPPNTQVVGGEEHRVWWILIISI